jgi:limonene-1,2-epoxide hydrolase
VAHTPRGKRHGVGIYKVANGKLIYYRDYMDPVTNG